MRVLITGANGFVGGHLCRTLAEKGYYVRAAVRRIEQCSPNQANNIIEIGDMGAGPDWSAALKGIDVVVHLAARAHVIRERAHDPTLEYWRTNIAGAERLASSAAGCAVRRFIYVSSIGVLGARTIQHPFTEADIPQPYDAYTRSKAEAEKEIRRIASGSDMEFVIIRPPLVYGPGVKGNFLRLLRLVQSGLPLPFARVKNQRSFVYVENLVDLLLRCVESPKASGEVFLAADDFDLSTEELICVLARHMKIPARLFRIPERFARYAAMKCGFKHDYERLFGSLQVDARKARDVLGWKAPYTFDEGFANTVKWFLNSIL